MKATLLLTASCNLRCDYCYVEKQTAAMSSDTLAKAVDFAFRGTPPDDRLDFGLFGGEPLLEWERAQEAVALIERRSEGNRQNLRLSLATNGTLLDGDILRYMRDHHLILQVSCDGVPHVQDAHRRYGDGRPTSAVVEANLRAAVEALPAVLVNVVFGPDTYGDLPESIEYLVSLGLKRIVLNPDYSAKWTACEVAGLKPVHDRIVELYLGYYEDETPVFISLIDEKIAIILRGGYGGSERCNMGYGEFAFSPQGFIFPCERLVGNGQRNAHCIGHLDQPDLLSRSHCPAKGASCRNVECQTCSVAGFCMNWCSCSNFHATGDYGLASHFLCASERLAIEAAVNVLKRNGNEQHLAYVHHYAGLPMANSFLQIKGGN